MAYASIGSGFPTPPSFPPFAGFPAAPAFSFSGFPGAPPAGYWRDREGMVRDRFGNVVRGFGPNGAAITTSPGMPEPSTHWTFPKSTAKIDARAVQRDMSGNVISSPGEKAFKDIHRDMSGNPISGKLIATGQTMNFPQPPSGLASLKPLSAPALPQGPQGGEDTVSALSGFPQSKISTGNRDVHFQGPQERLADMTQRASDQAASVASAAAGRSSGSPVIDRAQRDATANAAAAEGNIAAGNRAEREDTIASMGNIAAGEKAAAANINAGAGSMAAGERALAGDTKAAQGNIAVGDRALAANDAKAMGTTPTGFPQPQSYGPGAPSTSDEKLQAKVNSLNNDQAMEEATGSDGQSIPYGRDPSTGRMRGFPRPQTAGGNSSGYDEEETPMASSGGGGGGAGDEEQS